MKSVLCFFFICLSIQIEYSISQVIECPSEGISYIPLPDCTQYLICINGQGVEMECPRPLYYNPELQTCDFPENVPECVGGTRPPIGSSTTTSTTSTTSSPTPTESSTTNPTEEPTTPPPSNLLTQCGQTLQADSGVIEYKLNKTYDAGELCAFIVRLDKFIGCTFVLEAHGIYYSDPNALAIIPLFMGRQLEVNYLGPPNPNGNRLVLDGSAFVIIFKTNTDYGTGFRLAFESGNETISKVPGVLLVFNNETGSALEFPLYIDSPYTNQWDPIVLTSGAKLIDPGSSLKVTVWEAFPYNDCGDWFDVHTFDGERTVYLGRVCGTGSEQQVFHTRGVFIIVFSKRSVTSSPPVLGSLMWEKIEVDEK